jgi:hypothetical protein
MITRSKASMMKAMRTISWFQQTNSKPSELQRKFEHIAMTLPSWGRP